MLDHTREPTPTPHVAECVPLRLRSPTQSCADVLALEWRPQARSVIDDDDEVHERLVAPSYTNVASDAVDLRRDRRSVEASLEASITPELQAVLRIDEPPMDLDATHERFNGLWGLEGAAP
jgi:hypothetical protein